MPRAKGKDLVTQTKSKKEETFNSSCVLDCCICVILGLPTYNCARSACCRYATLHSPLLLPHNNERIISTCACAYVRLAHVRSFVRSACSERILVLLVLFIFWILMENSLIFTHFPFDFFPFFFVAQLIRIE